MPINKKRGFRPRFSRSRDWKRALLGGSRRVAALSALGDTGRLTATVAQVVQLGATDGAAAHDLDGLDVRRIDREHALDAFAVGDLADREALVEAATRTGYADALVG